MVGALLLITAVFSVWQILLCNTVNTGHSTINYVYPSGSLSCKPYNRTSCDCRYRNLISIPPLSHHGSLEKLDLSHNKLSSLPVPDDAFLGLYKLETLDLSYNNLSSLLDDAFHGLAKLKTLDLSYNNLPSLPDDAFHGLSKLKTLDLSYNKIRNIAGSPFKDLGLLQELNLGFNEIKSVDNDTFTGLKSLITLSTGVFGYDNVLIVYPVSVNGTPFIGLQSLRNLSISLDCTNTTLFIGLEKLAVLTVYCSDFSYIDPSWSDALCSLRSLDTLMISSKPASCITNKCLQNIPLKSLHYQSIYVPCSSSYEFLNNLTSLTFEGYISTLHSHYANCAADLIQSLSSIKSTLENLTVYHHFCSESEFVLDRTTFAPWSYWSSSLRYLDITINLFKIEGSPFALFTNLRKLRLTRILEDRKTASTVKLPRETFNGLGNLQELSLNVYIDVVTTNALHVFNNLTYLELKDDQIENFPDQLLLMSSITELDLSDNWIAVYPGVSFPNLRKMNLKNNLIEWFYATPSPCENSPHLYEIDLTGILSFWTNSPPLCPQLEVIHLPNSTIRIDGTVNLAHLKSLYLDHVTVDRTKQLISSVKPIMVMFNNTPNLTTLDLSSNQINDVDKEDAHYLRNLTYLNLANNDLTSVDKLQYLTNIKTLILNGNRITAVSDIFLSRSNFPLMEFLDLRNNPFECTCAIDAFRKLILQDDDIYLIADNGTYLRNGVYQCLTPDSVIGLSLTEIDLDCRFPLELYLSVSIASAFIAILMAISVIRYRWHIQYQLFLLCTRRKRYQNYLVDNDYGLDDDDDDDENGIPRFDAYVAYHEEDEDWVDGELLQNVEEGDERFRLCLSGRDVPAGRLKVNAVGICIQRSRKTLMILTPHFFEDNWCYFQLSMAHQRLLEEGRNVLILIILEEIPNDKMTLILRQLFCKVRCLKWPNDGYGQYLFWRRLKEEIKRPMPIDRRYHV